MYLKRQFLGYTAFETGQKLAGSNSFIELTILMTLDHMFSDVSVNLKILKSNLKIPNLEIPQNVPWLKHIQ